MICNMATAFLSMQIYLSIILALGLRSAENSFCDAQRVTLLDIPLTSVIAEVIHRLMIAEAIEKGHITEKNPLKKLRENSEIIKKLTTYSKNVEKISEMNIKIIALTNELIKKSSKIRSAEGLLTNDSLIVAALKDANLVNLATNDNDFYSVKWLTVFKPSDLQSC